MTDNQCHTKSVDVTPNVTNDLKRELGQAPHVEARRPCDPVLRWSTHGAKHASKRAGEAIAYLALGLGTAGDKLPSRFKSRESTPNTCTQEHMSIRSYDG